MKTIAVIGTGYVGLVSGTCFAEHGNQVICCDIDEMKIEKLQQYDIPIYEPGLEELVRNNAEKGTLRFSTNIPAAIQASDIIIIAVGTPMSPTGEADLSYVRAAAEMVGDVLSSYKVIVTKSTVPVGTGQLVKEIITERIGDRGIAFDVVSNPEFLREGSAVYDCMNMERAIIGSTSDQATAIMEQLYASFHTSIFITNLESAEMIKYASNAFLATKISFINSIANLCERYGADVTKVSEGMGMDSRISGKFLQAGIGYGGSCFPKDTEALHYMSKQVGYDFSILDAVMSTNQSQRMLVIDKVQQLLPDLKGTTIAVLGLAFKPNTDDLRCAPSLDIIPTLHELGATIHAYDPVALEEAKLQLGHDRIHYYTDAYAALADADVCVILTEWKQIIELDLFKVRNLMAQPHIVDGRNCYALDTMAQLGFNYYSIGRVNIQA